MDLTWIVGFLILVVILSIAFWIIRALIMPVVPVSAQPVVWAVIGIVLLIALLYGANGYWGSHHSLNVH
jgi:hypothetical protein